MFNIGPQDFLYNQPCMSCYIIFPKHIYCWWGKINHSLTAWSGFMGFSKHTDRTAASILGCVWGFASTCFTVAFIYLKEFTAHCIKMVPWRFGELVPSGGTAYACCVRSHWIKYNHHRDSHWWVTEPCFFSFSVCSHKSILFSTVVQRRGKKDGQFGIAQGLGCSEGTGRGSWGCSGVQGWGLLVPEGTQKMLFGRGTYCSIPASGHGFLLMRCRHLMLSLGGHWAASGRCLLSLFPLTLWSWITCMVHFLDIILSK